MKIKENVKATILFRIIYSLLISIISVPKHISIPCTQEWFYIK